ncbi:oligosaccharide flippase family protein [Candidatus Daviesbacteria bacterium]|nr:oligosaccharide flippase family protein [Candidatus Daviesbacteria bacterium]
MNKLLTVFKQTSFQLLAKLVTSLSTFLILSIIARTYGQESLGIFTLSIAYLGLFMMVSDFGLNGHLLKQIQNINAAFGRTKFKMQNEIFRKLLGTRIVWAIVLVVLSFVLLPFLSFSGREFMILTMVGSLSIISFAIFTSSNLIFQKNLRYDLSALSTIIGTVVYFLLVLAFSYQRSPLVFISFSSMAGWIIISFSSVLLVRKFVKGIVPIFDFKYTLDLFAKTWPIGTTLFLNMIYFRIDSFLLAFYRNLSEVGIYNLAYQFFQTALVLPIFIMNAYYPILIKSYAGLKSAILILLGISFLGIILTFIISPLLIGMLAGEGFEGSILSLRILSLGFPGFFISALLMWILVAEGKYKLLLKFYTSTLILNLILNLIFIPQYSYVAASWVTVISEYFVLLLQIIALRKIKL